MLRGLSEMDAYELLSKVARLHLNEILDPNYVVVSSLEKKYLPGRRSEGGDNSRFLSGALRVFGITRYFLWRKVKNNATLANDT